MTIKVIKTLPGIRTKHNGSQKSNLVKETHQFAKNKTGTKKHGTGTSEIPHEQVHTIKIKLQNT